MSQADARRLHPDPFADAILRRSRRRIEIFVEAGNDWRFAESLRSVSEDTAQEYEGRAVFELLQNGYDALGEGGHGRVLFVFDIEAGPHGTLYAANEGTPFTKDNFDAITEFGLSNKGAGEGIGNKGLGFRSVLQLTDWPEIYSKSQPDASSFDGYCFRFATPEDVAAIVSDPALVQEVVDKVSPLALPVPADVADPRLEALARAGFATTIRLPLRNSRAAAATVEQLTAMTDHRVPVLLFLERLTCIEIDCVTDEPWQCSLSREELPSPLLVGTSWVTEVDLGQQGRYLRATRSVTAASMKGAIEQSIADREIDEKWRDWEGEAAVSIAMSLDAATDEGRLYTFLPMSEAAPAAFAGHAHAPFFTKLARGDISPSVALNDFLLNEIALLARDLLTELVALKPNQFRAGLTIDLACWEPPDRISTAFEAAGRSLLGEQVLPVVGKARWGALERTHQWPHTSASVITTQALARQGLSVLDDGLDASHRERADHLHEALTGRSMVPRPSEIAAWVETLAARMQRVPTNMDTWADFYDDLAQIFSHDATALGGRFIILDQDRQLAAALGGAAEQVAKQTIFFAPDESLPDETVSRLPGHLRALRRRITFTHPDIPWNFAGNPPRRRPGRSFLEPSLVREYRTDRVFEALDDLLKHQQTDAFRRDALLFAYRQFATLNDAQRAQLRRYNFFVPIEGGAWRRATEALFHPAWGTEGGRRLQTFLESGGDSIAEFARMRDRWIAGPSAWPEEIHDRVSWHAFLAALGVRDGLLLFVLGARMPERDGNALRPEALASQFKVDDGLARTWPALVRQKWSEFAHPWTKYSFDHPLAYIPGAESVSLMGAKCRQEFAELVLHALPTWGDHNFVVRVRRPTRPLAQQDPHYWPTPLAAQLRFLAWLPIADEAAPDGVSFARPDRAWYASDGDLPAFIPSLTSSIRRFLQDDQTVRRLTAAGLRVWEEPRNGPELVRDLGDLLAAGSVPGHLAVHFKKHYQRAWAETLKADRWPWNDEDEPQIAVTETASLAVARPNGDTVIYIPDEDNHFKEALLDLAGYPVLIAGTDDGDELKRLFAANGIACKGFSDTEVQVEADGQVVSPDESAPLLVDGATRFPTVFGLVLELKSGEFRRRTERAVRDLMERVRAIRLLRATTVDVVIEGHSAATPPSTRSLPVDDASAPTVVVWGTGNGWDECRAASPAVAQLLKQPALHAPLELAIVKLEARLGPDLPTEIPDEDLAHALDAPVHRITELRRGLTGELVELVHRLRPALICLLGMDHQDEISMRLQRVEDERALRRAIASFSEELPMSIDVLLSAVRQAGSLNEVRGSLGIEFAAFNQALLALGSTYRPIVHPDLHDRVFGEFVAALEPTLIERLREVYAPLAATGQDVSRYVEGRRLDGLEPDQDWLERYETPPEDVMREAVRRWLQSHGAAADLEAPPALGNLSAFRETNFAKVDALVEQLRVRVVAWCRRKGRSVPTGWTGIPGVTMRGAIESDGLADLMELTDEAVILRSVEALGWPDGMPTSLSLQELELLPADLDEPSLGSGSTTPPAKPPPTIKVAGQTLEVGVDHLADIARAAHNSLDETFLGQSGAAQLGEPPGKSGGGGGGGSGFAVSRMPRMSDEQRAAIGLVGEIAAKAWLERRYQGVLWRSGYAAIIVSDPDASDSLGYDFEVPYRNTSLFFEVKALVDEPRELTEFEMGESEVRCAQECAAGDRYRIALVTSVLEPEARRLFILPSPFSRKGAGRFRVVGRGLRYRCQLGS
jgi:hypothetical protein